MLQPTTTRTLERIVRVKLPLTHNFFPLRRDGRFIVVELESIPFRGFRGDKSRTTEDSRDIFQATFRDVRSFVLSASS